MNRYHQLLAEGIVRAQDKALSEAIDKRLGVGWTLEELTSRLECVIFNAAPGIETYHLDGRPLLRLYPPEFSYAGTVITATQRVEHME